jgi:hypothetical protein
MKIIAGKFLAFSNVFFRLLLLSPTMLLMIYRPFIRKKNTPILFATAHAMTVYRYQVDQTRGYHAGI